jgi:Uma2 family endonuclease
MTALAKKNMSVDEFLAWAITQPEPLKADLIDGHIYAQAPQRLAHIQVKVAAAVAFRSAIKTAGLSCYAVGDGATVRISDATAFEPDALVYCGGKLPGDAIEVPNPVIVVEVLSPDSEKRDMRDKLVGYFLLPSIEHYLILDPEERLVIHHTRGHGDTRGTRLVREGILNLDPPGLSVDAASFFSEGLA